MNTLTNVEFDRFSEILLYFHFFPLLIVFNKRYLNVSALYKLWYIYLHFSCITHIDILIGFQVLYMELITTYINATEGLNPDTIFYDD